MPGKHHHVMFSADEEGTYRGQSATLSGQAYAPMRTEVEVVSPEEYEDFIKEPKTDIQAAQDRSSADRRREKCHERKPPELVVDGFPQRRPRWVEIVTSADHKDVGRLMIVAALGFLSIAASSW